MLTRLEIDGFKNLDGFVAEFGAFTCIAGENGVGKSNIFDAIEFLALIASSGLMEAARDLRSTSHDVSEPRMLFPNADPSSGPMRLAAEMIVPGQVEDDFGVVATPSITYLSYEVAIGYELSEGIQRHGRLVVESESLVHINLGDAPRRLGFRPPKQFREAVVRGRRAGGAFISTEGDRVNVHQDGGSRGRPRRELPTRANTTVVSTVNTADDPTILAARREMQSWRRLALEPSALRTSDRFTDPQVLASDGRHLAAALHRVATAPGADGVLHPEDVYARVAGRLAGLRGTNIDTVRVDADNTRELLTLMVRDLNGNELPARSLSEGTLRYLALCVLLEDPTVTGLICMEEPENGIYPGNLGEMVRLVHDLAVDTSHAPGTDNPLRQVVVNTHSPVVVQLVGENDLLLATEEKGRGPGHRGLRVDGVMGSWRADRDPAGGVPLVSFVDYLTPPPDGQMKLIDVA